MVNLYSTPVGVVNLYLTSVGVVDLYFTLLAVILLQVKSSRVSRGMLQSSFIKLEKIRIQINISKL